MDEAQIQEYINKALTSGLKGALGEFKNHFSEQLAPIAAKLAEFEAATTPAPATPDASDSKPTSNPETAALMERLAKMEQMEQTRQAELRQMKLDRALGSAVGKHSPIHQDIVTEILANRYGAKAIEKDGEFYLPNGSKLGEEVDSFFSSPAGQHFLANPSGQSLGTTTSKPPAVGQKSFKDLTSDEMFQDMVIG